MKISLRKLKKNFNKKHPNCDVIIKVLPSDECNMSFKFFDSQNILANPLMDKNAIGIKIDLCPLHFKTFKNNNSNITVCDNILYMLMVKVMNEMDIS